MEAPLRAFSILTTLNHEQTQFPMKIIILTFVFFAFAGCTSPADKAAQEQMQKEQLQLAIKKIDIACRDKYPLGIPGAIMKRKQCQQVGIESIDLSQK